MDDEISYGKPTVEEIKEYSISMNDKKRLSKSHLRESLNSSTSSFEFNFDDSFKTILETHLNNSVKNIKNLTFTMENSDNNETIFDLTNKNAWEDSTVETDQPIFYTMSDETFADLERACANDCNNKQTQDEEIAAMNRLFKDAVDQTQLNDIEEPSGLWENTFSNTQKISPVKMCGLLRPSTIIEEDSELNSSSDYISNTETESFKTAPMQSLTKNLLDFSVNDEITSNSVSFATAKNHTTLSSSSTTSTSIISTENSNLIEFTPLKKSIYDYPNTCGNITIQSSCSDGLSFKTAAVTANTNNLNSTEPLIDNEEILELSDDSFSCSSNKIINLNDNTLDGLSSFIDDSLNIRKDHITLNSIDSLEGASTSHEEDNDKMLNSSLDFNDTLEKMEYMMNEGLKLMAAKTILLNEKKMENIHSNKNDLNSTLDRTPNTYLLDSPKTPNTVIKKSYIKCSTNSPSNHFKHQKLQLKNQTTATSIQKKTPIEFKKPPIYPHPPSRIPQIRNLKKNNFDHVVSPISMYIKKTPIAPLTTADKGTRDIFNTRLCHIRDSNIFGQNIKENIIANNSPTSKCPFPKKAYFISDRNHIIDQRINPKVHGGEKINRLLENNSSPTITKHEGRVKLDYYSNHNTNNVDRYIDDSLADLSIMSGDVSVQVVKNADRFC